MMTLCKELALGQGECQNYVRGERPARASPLFAEVRAVHVLAADSLFRACRVRAVRRAAVIHAFEPIPRTPATTP
ncbi:hypothetical protein RCH17_000443 [Arthrobacter sp. MP_M7]|nr:hypothetical protein [Arthrobacter sp. MP_M4]MEC5201664.1 hypothetical protein [Arthrobacter sp. MP_M7]